MKHESEFDTSYFHNPHSPRRELLPLHHVAKGDGVVWVKGAIGSGSGSGSPLILAFFSSSMYSVFLCRPVAKSPEWGGGIYSRFYVKTSPRSPRLHQNDTQGPRWAPPCGQGGGPHGGPCFLSLWRPPLTSSSHGLLLSKKLSGKKFGSVWRPEGPWKSKTCKDKNICLASFVVQEPNERGLFRKPSESMANKPMSS
jgi:hypothetical protein